jgi:hypothetical protein
LAAASANVEENELLQERVKKASTYFSAKIDTLLLAPLSNTAVESDNKTLKKTVEDSLDLLYNEMKIKHSCLVSCENGFFIKPFLDARALAMLQTITRRKNQPSESMNGGVESLMKALKNWRNSLAAEHGVEPYLILQQKVMVEITEELPRSLKALAKIKGIGSKKIKDFGEELLEIITDYCEANQIEYAQEEEQVPVKQKVSSPKTSDTKMQSLQLFREGKTMQEIADERGLVVSTIEGHLSSFVATGEVQIEEVLPVQDIEKISAYFLTASDLSLNPARAAFGEQYSYGQLKLVRSYLEAAGKISTT